MRREQPAAQGDEGVATVWHPFSSTLHLIVSFYLYFKSDTTANLNPSFFILFCYFVLFCLVLLLIFSFFLIFKFGLFWITEDIWFFFTDIEICLFMLKFPYAYLYIIWFFCVGVRVCIYIYLCTIYMCVCVYVCMYVCMWYTIWTYLCLNIKKFIYSYVFHLDY